MGLLAPAASSPALASPGASAKRIAAVAATAAGAPATPAPQFSYVSSGRDDPVSLHASFSPLRLGGDTTIGFSFAIHSPKGTVPQPLIGIDLRLPKGLGAGTTNLGLATCTKQTILLRGPSYCPPNSVLGKGSAVAVLPIESDIVHEKVKVVLLAAITKSAQLQILYSAEGYTPVAAYLVFRGEILEGANPPYGDELQTFIPPIPTLPEAPYASVVNMSASIGPKHVVYYRVSHGRRIAFHPRGLQLPGSCPKGGFKFAARFTFLDGTNQNATTTVHCPRPTRHSHRRRG